MSVKIIIHLAPEKGQEIIGIKEDFATYCEKFGDVVKVEVEESIENYEQMTLRKAVLNNA